MIQKYRKKPVEIEALKWTGENLIEIIDFIRNSNGFKYDNKKGTLIIATLEGEHIASIGDFIIRGVKGEFYPCKPDIFEMTYEKI